MTHSFVLSYHLSNLCLEGGNSLSDIWNNNTALVGWLIDWDNEKKKTIKILNKL